MPVVGPIVVLLVVYIFQQFALFLYFMCFSDKVEAQLGGGGGGTLNFACYIRKDYFLGFKILNFTIVLVWGKRGYFLWGIGHL